MKPQVNQFRALQRAFNQELESNDRFPRMLWTILYLLILFVTLSIYDSAKLLRDSNGATERQVSRLLASESSEQWQVRLDAEIETFQQNKKLCSTTPSKEIASADLQTMLQRLASQFQVNDARLTVGEPEAGKLYQSQGWVIRAQIRGRAESGMVPPLVDALENISPVFVVERMDFLQRSTGTLNLFLAACFLEQA